MTNKTKLILMRHGKSLWNERNIFTGWVDVPLSEKGVNEAIEAGKDISDIPIDLIFVSALIRAQATAQLAMLHHHSGKIPIQMHEKGSKEEKWAKITGVKAKEQTIPTIAAWQLNERMYGDLQGQNKQEMRDQYGDEQVHIWRRSFDVAPPNGESLKDTADRVLPYFKENIITELEKGKNILISAHGNSLRSIIMFLDSLDKDQVVKLEVPTGKPIIYEYEKGSFIKQ